MVDNITSCIIAGAIVVLTMVYYLSRSRHHSSLPSPPGPRGLPIVGSFFSLDMKRFHLTLCELGKRYGDVFMVNMFGERILILNSIGAIREAFVDVKYTHIFAGRPLTFWGEYMFAARQDMTFQTYTESWSKQRKMAFKLMSFYGKGVEKSENTVKAELRCVVETLKATNGKPVELMASIITPSLVNIINILLKGERWPYDDKRMEKVVAFNSDTDRLLNPDVDEILKRFPFLRHIPYGPGKIWQPIKPLMEAFFELHFKQVKDSYKEGVSRGMTDDMITVQHENLKESGICWPSDMNIKGMLVNFMTAGVITTRASLSTFFLIMVHRPDIFNKIQQEVDTVIGRDRVSTLADRKMMPYTQAVLFENLRYNSHIPLSIPHAVTQDVEFRGYFIPKDTKVVPNLWAAHKDAAIWNKPGEFYPEHFLDESGNLLPKEDKVFRSLIAFGIGKRQCIGETFAKNRIFFYVTTLAQNFNFLPADKATLPSHDPTKHLPLAIKHAGPYHVCVVPRDTKE